MKKKDLLLSDFENHIVSTPISFKGGYDAWEKTSDGCTEGDEGCCDNDTLHFIDESKHTAYLLEKNGQT